MNNKQKTLLAIGIIFVVGLIVLTSVLLYQRAGKVAIKIKVAPSDCALTLDDAPISQGEVYVTPGEHTIKATREMFIDEIVKINTNDLKPQQIIYITPVPTEEGFDWLLTNPKAQSEREAVGDAEATQIQSALSDNYPFLAALPHETTDYKVNYSINEYNVISFEVTLYPISPQEQRPNSYKQELIDYKQEAIKYLKSIGIDSTNYVITFTPDPDKL